MKKIWEEENKKSWMGKCEKNCLKIGKSFKNTQKL